MIGEREKERERERERGESTHLYVDVVGQVKHGFFGHLRVIIIAVICRVYDTKRYRWMGMTTQRESSERRRWMDRDGWT